MCYEYWWTKGLQMADKLKTDIQTTETSADLPQVLEKAQTSRPAQPAYELPAKIQSSLNRYLSESLAPNTQSAYRKAWDDYLSWCQSHDLRPLPASAAVIGAYLTYLADKGLAYSTIEQRLAAVCFVHEVAKMPVNRREVEIRRALKAIKKRNGAKNNKKSAITVEMLRLMVLKLDDSLAGLRDKAMLLIGFAGGLRRSEVASLDVEDLEEYPEGYLVTLGRSKTDQIGQGRPIEVAYGKSIITCPVRATKAWLKASRIESGALFRQVDRHGHIKGRISGRHLANLVKSTLAMAGFEPGNYSAHSLRSGYITASDEQQVPEHLVRQQTGHRSKLQREDYVRVERPFARAGERDVGL
jgi:site-specific recombinase XerD